MNQTLVRRTILLTIITFGIYNIFWWAKRRDELIEKYKVAIPHWIWLIIPGLVSIIVWFSSIIVIVNLVKDPVLVSHLTIYSSYVMVLIPFAIAIWWVYRFSKVIAKLTEYRLPTGWSVALFIFWGPLLVPVQQYFINRHHDTKKLSSKRVGPSKSFVIKSSIAIAVSIFLTILSFILFPVNQDINDIKNQEELYQKSERLYREHNACMDKLNQEYPEDKEIAEEEYDGYLVMYNRCEEIRKEQNAASDAYNKL
jgi:hypothetical protein